MAVFIPKYRYGTVPDSHRVPSCDAREAEPPRDGRTNNAIIIQWRQSACQAQSRPGRCREDKPVPSQGACAASAPHGDVGDEAEDQIVAGEE